MQHPNNQNVCLCNNEVVGIFIKHCWADDMTRKGLDKKATYAHWLFIDLKL